LKFGARQVGKTSLIKNTINEYSFLWLNGDELDTQLLLENITSDRLNILAGNHKIIVIDEAQMIHNIGLLIKRMMDNFSEIQIIASESSAFELVDKTKESKNRQLFKNWFKCWLSGLVRKLMLPHLETIWVSAD
jgi:predicted AAA+ superfamily ATPase